VAPGVAAAYVRMAGRPVDLRRFRVGGRDGPFLLRPGAGKALPHLATAALTSVLRAQGIDHEVLDLQEFWHGTAVAPRGDFDVVGISTTFIWDQASMKAVIDWTVAHYPGATVVLGGQYSNFKFQEILAAHPEVDYVIRGDAEVAFPQLLRALDGDGVAADVPNLAVRQPDGRVVTTDIQYVDIETQDSPSFDGSHGLIPYESMRGCPFTCKFCSYPVASPKWRYKSADKILRDWTRYAETNGASAIRSMDSTFTVPPTRFRTLLETLPSLGVQWEAYTRANVITSREVVEQLEQANCRFLFIGFESMSDVVLKRMSKAVFANQNVRAIEAFRNTTIDLRGSFLVGYPGETPEEYQSTHDFIVNHFHGRFNVHFFIMQDETMPVWQDAQIYDLRVTNPFTWTHTGMDSATAMTLRERTIHAVRWQNDEAIHDVWQSWHDRPIHPTAPLRTSYRIEKAIERLAFAVRDLGESESTSRRVRGLLGDLEGLGVDTAASSP
jgi:tRNA A37 methylthiotransferase MiaB